MNTNDLEKLQDELKWVRVRDEQNMSFLGKLKSKGITGVLVPVGCLFTAGILCSGVYFMSKRNSKMQQSLMRYRVAAQAITLVVATIGIFTVPLTQSKSQ